MISLEAVSKGYGGQSLLTSCSWRIGRGERIGLVGPNGAGKTTLCRILASVEEPDAGRVHLDSGVSVGYLPQEVAGSEALTVLAEALSGFDEVWRLEGQLEQLAARMAGPEADPALVDRYGEVQHRFEALGGYRLEAQAKVILGGLGFKPDEVHRPLAEFSGGWRMRAALARLLLLRPDLLLLDEPTNHLDLESLGWLEGFLASYDGSVVLVSHDRYFLNRMVTAIADLAHGDVDVYPGDYDHFLVEREARRALTEARARNQAKRVAEIERFIERFRYQATKARQVQSRIKMLEKVERIEEPKRGRKAMKVGFPQPPRSGRVVIELDGLDFAYGKTRVYDGLDVVIERGEKVALVGPNGAGKTTLLKLLAGVLTPQAGERRLGHNVALGYFAQHQIEALDPSNRVIEELARAIPAGTTIRPRDLLGRFLFSGDDVDKPVSVLSGGERTRLALAKLLVEPVNFLCLDEPTNHLDIESRDVLEDALVEYAGTIVLITHDRHLIRSIANRIIEVTSGVARSFLGDYDDYLYRKTQEENAEEATLSPTTHSERPKVDKAELRRVRAAVRRIETELEAAHAERERFAQELADPLVYTRGKKSDEVMRGHTAATRRVAELESEWERLTGSMDE